MTAIAQASAGPVSGSKLDNRRVLAALIDLVVVGAGGAVILAAAGVLGESPSEIGAPLVLVTLGWALYYYFACESGNGQTLGKRVMNIRVVGLDGQPAGMREIALRTVLRVIDMQVLYLVGLIVMMATGERRGRLGDLVGKTMIVSADQPAATAPAAAPAEPASRVPIAESGPAFADVPEELPEANAREADEPEPAEPEAASPEVASPALQELAADVTAVTSAPDRVVEEPVAEAAEEAASDEPAAEAASEEPATGEPPSEQGAPEEAASEEGASEEPAAEEAASEEPAAEEAEEAAEDEPVVEVLDEQGDAVEDEDKVTVKSVETISAIDLVMDDSRRDS
jgi:uncharacterized RDD family membrane protein YckC